jgi:hypothetical protein
MLRTAELLVKATATTILITTGGMTVVLLAANPLVGIVHLTDKARSTSLES